MNTKEVAYIKHKKKGLWVLLSLINPLETKKAKDARLKEELKKRAWMDWMPSKGPVHAGMWTQLIVMPPEGKETKKARLKAETVLDNLLIANKIEIFLVNAIKETLDKQTQEYNMPLISRGINKDGFFVRLRNTNHVQ
jgi:hypothetical protein